MNKTHCELSNNLSFIRIYVLFEFFIKDVEVANDKEDTRSLHITIHKPVSNAYVKSNPPILNAKFTFDDHIRCMTAKQNLSKGRLRYLIFFFFQNFKIQINSFFLSFKSSSNKIIKNSFNTRHSSSNNNASSDKPILWSHSCNNNIFTTSIW